MTTLDTDRFLVEDVLDLYHGRGAEDRSTRRSAMSKKIQTAGAPTRSVGRNCGKLPANGYGTCASHLERRCKGASDVRWSGLPPKKHLPFS
jgi:hypothetical protein